MGGGVKPSTSCARSQLVEASTDVALRFSQYGKAFKYWKRTATSSQITSAHLASNMNVMFRLMIISTAKSFSWNPFRKRALIAWNILKRNVSAYNIEKRKKRRRLFHVLFIPHYANEKYLNAELEGFVFFFCARWRQR